MWSDTVFGAGISASHADHPGPITCSENYTGGFLFSQLKDLIIDMIIMFIYPIFPHRETAKTGVLANHVGCRELSRTSPD
jgi:hypothetical protein